MRKRKTHPLKNTKGAAPPLVTWRQALGMVYSTCANGFKTPEHQSVAHPPFRMRSAGSVLGCAFDGGCGGNVFITEWELTVNGEGTGIYFDTEAEGRTYIGFARESASEEAEMQKKEQEGRAPANSRTDLVLYPAGSGEAYHSTGWFWEKDWRLGTCQGGSCSEDPKKDTHTVSLSEQVNGKGDWKSGGNGKGGFEDLISPEERTITQRFSVDDKRVQVVLGKDSRGNLIRTWDVTVVVHGIGDSRPPTYSPSP